MTDMAAKTKLKVLMVPSWYPTEDMPLLGTFYKEQAEALAARGVDVAVAYVNVDGNFRAHHGIRYRMTEGIPTYIYTHPNYTPRMEKGRCWQRTRMLQKLYKQIEAQWGRPDVVNLRSSLQGYEVMALCEKERLPLFFMEHSSYVITEPENSLIRRRMKEVMEASAVCACVSSAVQAVMQPVKETRIIPDCVDTERFHPMAVRRCEGEEDAFVFRAMGQLRPVKGFDVLIKAFAVLKKQTGRPVYLDIAGMGGLREILQQSIDALGIADTCRLVGTVPRDKVVEYMNGCDCFICPSRTETLSCVLNESAACGKPLISTLCGGPQDIITDEVGLMVPTENPEALAQAMLAMLDRAKTYDAGRIRQLTIERFGTDAVCRKLIAACEDAVKAGK